jgi:phage head maturation protease
MNEVFRGFPQSLTGKFRDSILKLAYDRFLRNPFEFINNLSHDHSTLYGLSYWKIVVK